MIEPYITLISSLPPHIPQLFASRRPPISRIKLDERLQMLSSQHVQDLEVIENLVHWDRMAISMTDLEMIQRGEATMRHLKSSFIKDIIIWRLANRTIIVALRRRLRGLDVSTPKERWGFGRWVSHIEKNWHEPTFRLEKIIPWLPEAYQLLQEKNHLGLERLLLSLAWDYYGRVAAGHYFDFEAVVIYVLRWDVIDRWSRYNNKLATHRLERMLKSGLGDYNAIFSQYQGQRYSENGS